VSELDANIVNTNNSSESSSANDSEENDGDDSQTGEEDAVSQLLRQLQERYNITAVIIDNDGQILYTSSPNTKNLLQRLIYNVLSGEEHVDEEENQIIEETDTYKIMITDRLESNYMQCWGYLQDGSAFMLSLPIQSIEDSVSVANDFYLIIGLIVIFFSVIYMLFMTRSMTKPILELAAISERMANLDFKVKYQGDAKDEIGILGTSMNHMSEQLEKTISELQEVNQKLIKDIEEKIQIDDMRKEFLSNISHELKTPIALIQGYAEGLQDCINDDPESREFYCEVIVDEAGKMNTLVQKLLNLNHLEFGNDRAEKVDFDMVELIQGVVSSTEILLKQKEGKLNFHSCTNPMMVCADEFMMEDVIRNYISNACNHLDGEKKIDIWSEEVSSNKYRISVKNTGKQIPEPDLEKVWIKFYKVDKARTREYGGSGIGLSIVKAIMDAHQCDYGVYNEADGVVFWFDVEKAQVK
jgi:signal transduction histidine kinase